MQKTNNGFILVLSLLMVSVLVVVVTAAFYAASNNYALTKILVRREKAKILALSGVQLAISNLTVSEEKQEGQEKGPEANPEKKSHKKLLEKILPKLNRWNHVEFTEKDNSFEGEIDFCISSETGKLNINELYDFDKHQFKKPEYQELLKKFCSRIDSITSSKNTFDGLVKFLKESEFAINDVTELLGIKEFEYFKQHIFYDPELAAKNIFLLDLFTNFTSTLKIEPWLLSNSIALVLGCNSLQPGDENSRLQSVPEWLNNFKDKNNWQSDWDNALKPIYGKEFKSIEKNMSAIFNSSFQPESFSIIAYGKFGEVVQKVYAILHFKQNQDKFIISLEKLYWI